MKSKDIFVGNIHKCTYLNTKEGFIPEIYGTEGMDGSILMGSKKNYEVEQENILLSRFGLTDAWFYSPKYHRILPTIPAQKGYLFVSDLELFDYNNIQKKENISKIQLYQTFRKYLKDLVNPQDFYLVDIVMAGDEKYVVTYHRNILAQKIGNRKFWCGKEFGIKTDIPTNMEQGYITDAIPFNFNDINLQKRVTRTEMDKTYKLFKESSSTNH